MSSRKEEIAKELRAAIGDKLSSPQFKVSAEEVALNEVDLFTNVHLPLAWNSIAQTGGKLPRAITSVITSWIKESPTISNADGAVQVSVSFRIADDLSRESLNPNNDGIDNIVALLNEGFSTTKNTPYGLWTSPLAGSLGESWIKGLQSRPSSPFLELARDFYITDRAGQILDISLTWEY